MQLMQSFFVATQHYSTAQWADILGENVSSKTKSKNTDNIRRDYLKAEFIGDLILNTQCNKI